MIRARPLAVVLLAIACRSGESSKESTPGVSPDTGSAAAKPTGAATADSLGSVGFDGRVASLPGFNVPWDTTSIGGELVRIDSLAFPQFAGAAASRLVFEDSSSLLIPVRDVALLSRLDGVAPRHWLLVSGYACSECDAPIAVYAVRSSTGAYPGMPRGFPHPGEVAELGSNEPFYRGRMFVGVCAPATASHVVWLEEVADSVGAWHRQARVLLARSELTDSVAEWTAELEAAVDAAVRRGRCREIAGINQ